MSFCPNCGTQLEGNPLFCPECGTYLLNATTEEPVNQAAAVQQPAQQAQPVQPQPQPQAQQPQQTTYYQPPVQQAPGYNTLPQQQPNTYTGYASAEAYDKPDKASVGIIILSVLFPIVGLILFFVKKKKQPKAAKAYLTAAAISVLVSIALSRLGESLEDAAISLNNILMML